MTLSAQNNDRFEVVHTIQHPDGPSAVITRRVDTGIHSFSVRKEYVGSDGPQRSNFFNRRHVAALRALLDQVEDWLDREADRSGAQKAAAR